MPHELSGGMKQKVSIARCLAMKSKLMLMDEPFASLVEQTRLRLNREDDRYLAAGKKDDTIYHPFDTGGRRFGNQSCPYE